MVHCSGSRLYQMYKEFDKGGRPGALSRDKRFEGLKYKTCFFYHEMWKKEGGKHKLYIIQSVKHLLRKKIDSGVSEEEKATIPNIIKYLESRPYEWFHDKTPALALNSAIDVVTDYPRCLWEG